jgi:hypothetical protein
MANENSHIMRKFKNIIIDIEKTVYMAVPPLYIAALVLVKTQNAQWLGAFYDAQILLALIYLLAACVLLARGGICYYLDSSKKRFTHMMTLSMYGFVSALIIFMQ